MAQVSQPVKLLVGFPAGGGTDAVARILAEPLKAALGVPVIVENKAGAGGQIAAQALKAAAADGHTLSELGVKGFEDVPYYGVFAPAGTPKATIAQID